MRAIRLTQYQVQSIKDVFVLHFLKGDSLWLFGSRVDPLKKGGDIDLYIETAYSDEDVVVQKEIAFLIDLKKKIGNQKIDLVVRSLNDDSVLLIYEEAKNTGIQLI